MATSITDTGFGADIGVQFVHADQYKIGLSVLDIGAINYNRHAAAFHLQTNEADFNWWQAHLHSNLAVDRTLSAVFYNGDSTKSQVGNGFSAWRCPRPSACRPTGRSRIISLSMPRSSRDLGHGDRQGGVQPDIYSITPRL